MSRTTDRKRSLSSSCVLQPEAAMKWAGGGSVGSEFRSAGEMAAARRKYDDMDDLGRVLRLCCVVGSRN